MRTGYKRTLQTEDLYVLNDDIKVKTMADRFEQNLAMRLEKARADHIAKKCKERNESPEASSVSPDDDLEDFEPPKFAVLWSILYTFRLQFGLACLWCTLANSGQACNPLLSKKLISFVERRVMGYENAVGKGVGYALGASFMVLAIGFFINHAFYRSMLTGAQVKAVLTKSFLDKSFRLSDKSMREFPSSKITSMMGTDLARLDFAFGFQPFLISFPIPVAISIGILIWNIGAPALVGIGLVFVFLICIILFSGKLFQYRRTANKYTDARVGYIKEVLNNLKIIKFYSWENAYYDAILFNRNHEMDIVYKMQVGRNMILSLAMCLTLFASMSSFLVLYATKNNTGDPASLFSSISLFNSLSQQVIMLPMALASGSDAIVGIIRATKYLAAPEVDELATKTEASPETKELMDKEDVAIRVTDACFEWESYDDEKSEDQEGKEKQEEKKNASAPAAEKNISSSNSEKEFYLDAKTESGSDEKGLAARPSDEEARIFGGLKNIDLEIKKNMFIVITGVIGSGKSSFLQALSGFMKRTQGELDVNGSLLLCEIPWIQNTTVRENIVFGHEFDQKKYDDIIYACSLESDLEMLPAGDETEIGERGINLSGGQKARINLARAVYAETDIILLDDVLSAVDARVGKHIMTNCILGLLKDKTRILATHQLSLIGAADKVVFLNGDGSIDIGTMSELKQKNEGFHHLMQFSSDSADDKEEEKIEDQDEQEEEKEMIERQVTKSLAATVSAIDEEELHHDYKKNEENDGRLILEERRAVNQIQFRVYKNYIKYGSGIFKGYSIVPFVIILTMLTVFCQLFTNTWLTFWSEFKFHGKGNGFYIGFYVMFTVLAFVFLSTEFIAIAYLTNEAATILNLRAVQRILKAPMAFMDTTPMGRILNRFTKDTDTLDNEIGNQIRMLIFFLSQIIGVIVLCIIYLPWFAIAIPFLAIIFISVTSFYQASAREIKRLEATERSLVYNNFNETLSGMRTIKAYKAQQRFVNKNAKLIDNMNEAYYLTIANQRWLSIHLDLVAAAMAIIVCFLCVFRVFNISAASTGLLLSYVLQIAGQLSMLIRTVTQVENEMNSVERICEFAFDLDQEAPHVISETTPRPTWPEQGSISFINASLAYRPGLPLVLKKLNMDIQPQEKIGICGRTGAGKSSIMTALYRLSELQEGRIEIDGIDISTLGLNSLRSKLSIIPQDPVLFKGTVRKNLDPFGQSNEEELWSALTRSGLVEKSKIETVRKQSTDDEFLHKFHLEREVDADGANFSLGERQLLAFARAMVRGSKILILDEATSSVDYETDSKIQATIAREFSDCTILCIAHRLKTIINYDRILVLDRGEIKEFDTPWNLFNSKNSIFQQMCERSNITEADFAMLEGFKK